MSTETISEHKRPRDLVGESEYREWVKSTGVEKTALPWNADPIDQGIAPWVDTSIRFGSQQDANFAKVSNWVQVDDLCGMGALWCGSFGGKFYLKVGVGAASGDEVIIAEAAGGEEIGMLPVGDGGGQGESSCNFLPRRACPMAEREKLLKVGGRWRSDLYWDTLINGPLTHQPPGMQFYYPISVPYRYFSLRMVQVGAWLCFHSQLSAPTMGLDATGNLQATDGRHYYIGYSQFNGRPFLYYDTAWTYTGYYYHGWTAEPPWGKNESNSYQEDTSLIAPAASPGDSDYPYCRVFPRLTIGEAWYSPYQSAPVTTDGKRKLAVSAETVEQEATRLLQENWLGGSPDWMEDFLGLAVPTHYSSGSYSPDEPRLLIEYYNLEPSVSATKVFSAHLPMTGGGSVYLALYTGTIDGCLLTACACLGYNYWG